MVSDMEEAEFLVGKTVKWAGIVINQVSSDAEFVMRFTDSTSCTLGAWQTEGCPVEMSVEITSGQAALLQCTTQIPHCFPNSHFAIINMRTGGAVE